MRGAIPPLSQYAFMAWCSVKKRHLSTQRVPVRINFENNVRNLSGGDSSFFFETNERSQIQISQQTKCKFAVISHEIYCLQGYEYYIYDLKF
jgi:hypothetical protein